MDLKYEYKGEYYDMKLKKLSDLEARFKISLKRKLKIDVSKYLTYLGFDVENCRICNIGNVPVKLDIVINDGLIKINNFKYSREIYCYGNNKRCEGIKMNSNSFEYISKVKNVSLEEANKILKERNNSPFYKESFENQEEYSKNQSRSIEYFIKKYGHEKTINKHKKRNYKRMETWNNNPKKEELKKTMGITLDNLYKKYGDYDLAKNKYDSWRKKVVVPLSKASKESLSIFNKVISWCVENKIDYNDIYIGNGGKSEYFIRNKENIYFYDFTIRSKKIIIEYNGVAFHPKNENSNWINPFDKTITSKDAYNKQKNKIDIATKKGFSVLEIWSDGNNNYEKCIKFIKNKIK